MTALWDRIRVFFHDSETVLWARLQMLGGLLVVALAGINWSKLLDTSLNFKQIATLGGIMTFQGLVTEISRRLREPHNLGVKTVDDLSNVMVTVKKADNVMVNKASGKITIEKAGGISPAVVARAKENEV